MCDGVVSEEERVIENRMEIGIGDGEKKKEEERREVKLIEGVQQEQFLEENCDIMVI